MWTWQLGNVQFDKGASGRATSPLWVRWPETWREHTKKLPRFLPLICSMPGTPEDAENAFKLLAGHLLTAEQFRTHGGAAYPFILNRKWYSSLPDNKAAAADVKRAALSMAFAELVNLYALVEILLDGGTHTLADVAKHYKDARQIPDAFDDFGHLANWLHVAARNRVRLAMRIEWPQPVESKPAHVRRKRLRANGECTWCWSAVVEHAVPLRGNRVCEHCGIALPRGVWVGFTEAVCRRRAADPLVGPGVPTRIQLDDRRSWPRFTGPRTVPPSIEGIADEDGTLDRIAKRDAEQYANRDLVLGDGTVVPLRATAGQLWAEDDRCAAESRQRDARREGIPAHLHDDGEPRRVTNRPHGIGVKSDRSAWWTGNGVAAEEDGFTAPASGVHYAKDGAVRLIKKATEVHLPQPDSFIKPTDGATRELKYIRRMIRQLVRARRFLVAKMPLNPGPLWPVQVTLKGTEAHRARLREQRAYAKAHPGRKRLRGPKPAREVLRRLPATYDAAWLYAGLESQCYDVTYALDDLVVRRSRLLAEDDDPQRAAFKTRKNESLYIN